MRPSRVVRVYLAVSLIIGFIASVPLAMSQHSNELSADSTLMLTLCLNVLLLMLSPIVLDWSERKYFKARFVQLQELAEMNPELKTLLEAQCEKLSLAGLRLAAVETANTETSIYGLFRQNPRLVVPTSWLSSGVPANVIPTIEGQLNRFATRDFSFYFLGFAVLQIGLQQIALGIFFR